MSKSKLEELLDNSPGNYDNHYHGKIQPVMFSNSNNFGLCEGNVIKYICRHAKKNGEEDLNKAIWYINYLKDQSENKSFISVDRFAEDQRLNFLQEQIANLMSYYKSTGDVSILDDAIKLIEKLKAREYGDEKIIYEDDDEEGD